MPDTAVHSFQKTARERVVVSRGEYRGRGYVSLWVHWLTPGGEWVPSKKGLTLRSELVPELEDALRHVCAQAAQTGACASLPNAGR